jgi:hypothetical protein
MAIWSRAKLITFLAVATGAVLAVLGLSACGTGDSSTSTDAGVASLSHSQVLRQGDKICVKAGTRVSHGIAKASRAAAKDGKQLTVAHEEAILRTVTGPAIVEMADELARLVPPPSDQAKLAAIASAFEAAGRKLERKPAVGVRTDVFTRAARMAGAYGLHACSAF